MLTQEDLLSIKGLIRETLEEVMIPRFDKIYAKLEEHDTQFKKIFVIFEEKFNIKV